LRLGKLFGNSAEFWLNAQRAVDLWDAAQAIKDDVASIKTLSPNKRMQQMVRPGRVCSKGKGPRRTTVSFSRYAGPSIDHLVG
jgi:hypothetical protein